MTPEWHCWGPVGCASSGLGYPMFRGWDLGIFFILGTVTLWSCTSTVGEIPHPITHVPKERVKPPWEQAWTASLWGRPHGKLGSWGTGEPSAPTPALVRLAVSHQLRPWWMELPEPGASPTPRNLGSILFFSFSPRDTHPMAYPNVSRRCQLLVHKCILGKKLKQKKKQKKGKKIFNLSLVTIYINI